MYFKLLLIIHYKIYCFDYIFKIFSTILRWLILYYYMHENVLLVCINGVIILLNTCLDIWLSGHRSSTHISTSSSAFKSLSHSLIRRLVINTCCSHPCVEQFLCLFVFFPILSPHQDAPLSPKPPSPDSDSCPSSPKPPASVSTHLVSVLQRLGVAPGLLAAAHVAAYRRVSAQSLKHLAQSDKEDKHLIIFSSILIFSKGVKSLCRIPVSKLIPKKSLDKTNGTGTSFCQKAFKWISVSFWVHQKISAFLKIRSKMSSG